MAMIRVRWWTLRRVGGLLAGVALVAAVTLAIELLDDHVPISGLLALYLLAVVPVAVVWGPGTALTVAVASAAVFTALFLTPVHLQIAQPGTLIPLAAFLLTAAVVGELAARLQQRARESMRLGEEQAALRRIATLVATGTPAPELFDAVTREVAVISGADIARLERFEPDGTVAGVAVWSRGTVQPAVGTRFALEGLSIAAKVRETGRPARVESFAHEAGPIAQESRQIGIRSSVGGPIIVGGRLWGVIAASTKSEKPFPPDTEAQISAFTELVATAIANAQSRSEITGLLADQAALRRVATLVARGTPTSEVVAAVAEEVRQLFGAAATIVVRQDDDGIATVMSRTGVYPDRVAKGTRWELETPQVLATALLTARPAILEDLTDVPGAIAAEVRGMGIRAAMAIPIIVGGRTWGALAVTTKEAHFPPDSEQRIAGFIELVSIAVTDAEHAEQLAASRARIVAASDEARRRIERDLHDGAQQRLVALGLELRLAQQVVPPELPEVSATLGRVADELGEVLDELREMSRGIHPAILTEGGLGPALRALARRSTIPVELDVRVDARFPEPVEVAAYYAASEALTNTAKHADASYVGVAVEEKYGCLRITVQDDGVGGAESGDGSGLIGIRDRVEALGGRLEVVSPEGKGTVVQVDLPLDRH